MWIKGCGCFYFLFFHFQTTNLFKGFVTSLMPPCGLHLILAHHRYLYKFMHDIVVKRGMDSMIPEALRKIGCGFLGYQVDQYFKRYIYIVFILIFPYYGLCIARCLCCELFRIKTNKFIIHYKPMDIPYTQRVFDNFFHANTFWSFKFYNIL